ncbi:MAG TPA: helix-turn-helix domain-containing protein, partial [Propionibacteriaceae bacterium]|nr:helix-turn-helix domain-containing protein [Propionibacteriaceae bacterium]
RSRRAIPRTRTERVMNEVADERLMTIADLSMMLGVPIDTLYGWRHRGEGPRGYRVGRHVRYRRSSVEAWLEDQADRRQSTRE